MYQEVIGKIKVYTQVYRQMDRPQKCALDHLNGGGCKKTRITMETTVYSMIFLAKLKMETPWLHKYIAYYRLEEVVCDG